MQTEVLDTSWRTLLHQQTHSSWHPLLESALAEVSSAYLAELQEATTWLPGLPRIFNAFSLPLSQLRYILFGESPYPRAHSANGYAFWDEAVQNLWSPTGLAPQVNRATSLRHFMKMLLLTEGLLSPNDTSQTAIAAINKTPLIQTGSELFGNSLKRGFLLLNASLVLSQQPVKYDAKHWWPFMAHLLTRLAAEKPDVILLLFGKIAQEIQRIPAAQTFRQLCVEHPYNRSFMHRSEVQNFFRPLHLLRKSSFEETAL